MRTSEHVGVSPTAEQCKQGNPTEHTTWRRGSRHLCQAEKKDSDQGYSHKEEVRLSNRDPYLLLTIINK